MTIILSGPIKAIPCSVGRSPQGTFQRRILLCSRQSQRLAWLEKRFTFHGGKKGRNVCNFTAGNTQVLPEEKHELAKKQPFGGLCQGKNAVR